MMGKRTPLGPGDRFGRLTIEREAGRDPHSGAVLWQLRCECGGGVVRSSGRLVQLKKRERAQMCNECARKLRKAKGEQARKMRRAYFVSHGSLYSETALVEMENDIRDAVRKEM